MRRPIAILALFITFGALSTSYYLYQYRAKEVRPLSLTAPDQISEAASQPEAAPDPVESKYITSFPCDCEGDRVLYLTDPWMRGPEVVELQKLLQSLGEYEGGIDGVFGPKTEAAVKSFQQKRGLSPDGEVDLDTWHELANSLLPAAGNKTLPPPGEVRIKVDIYDRKLTIYSDETPYKSYPVAVGKSDSPTPVGYFRIVSKEKWGEGFGTRWMQLSSKFGKYGIHGTNKPWSIGSYASHGCIRMHNRHVEEIFEWVKIGTPVNIIKGPWGQLGDRPTLRRGGIKGSPVMLVQKRLKQLGYYEIGVDGIFGYGTQQAVKAFQKDHGLEETGIVDQQTYDALGLIYFE